MPPIMNYFTSQIGILRQQFPTAGQRENVAGPQFYFHLEEVNFHNVLYRC